MLDRNWLHRPATRRLIYTAIWLFFAVASGFILGASTFSGLIQKNPSFAFPAKEEEKATYESTCGNTIDEKQATLCEQKRQADAAVDAVFLATLQLYAGMLGLGAVIVTLHLNMEATAAAKSAAKAANRQVLLSQDSMEATQRASVFLGTFELHAPANKEFITIIPKWENAGSTPTRRMLNYINWQVFEIDGPPIDFDFPDFMNGNPSTPIVLGPKATVHASACRLDQQLITDIADDRKRFLIWGWTDYDDVFPNTKRHRTEFCNEVKITKLADAANVKLAIEFPVFPKFNATDDDCYREPKAYSFYHPRKS